MGFGTSSNSGKSGTSSATTQSYSGWGGREGTNAGPGGGANTGAAPSSAGKSGMSVSGNASAGAGAGKSVSVSVPSISAGKSSPSQSTSVGKSIGASINGNPSGNSYSEGNSVSSGAGAGKSVSVSVPSISRSTPSTGGIGGLFSGYSAAAPTGFMPIGGIQTATGFTAPTQTVSQPQQFTNVSLGKTSRSGVPSLDSGRFGDGMTASAQLGVPSAGVAAKAGGLFTPSTKAADFATASTIGNASKNDFSTMAAANKATKTTADMVSRVSSYLAPPVASREGLNSGPGNPSAYNNKNATMYAQLETSMSPVGAMGLDGAKSQDPLQGFYTGRTSDREGMNSGPGNPAGKMNYLEGLSSGPGNPSAYNNQGLVSTKVNVHDRIAKNEGTDGQKGYNTIFGGKQKDLSNMSLAQTAALGVAAGKFQALPGTLRDFAKATGLDMNATKFTPSVQDAFGNWTVGRRIDAASKRPGGLTVENLAVELTKEYASLAGPNGKSYYAGDGVNKAHNNWADTKDIAKNIIDINNGKFPSTVNNGAAATTQVAQKTFRDPYVSAPNYRGPTDATTTSATSPSADTNGTSANGTAAASAGTPAVAIDETGTAVPNSQTMGGKIAAGAIDVATTTAGGIPGAVVEVASQAIFGKSVGEMVVDNAGNMFTLNGNGTLTPTTEIGGAAEQKLWDDRAAAEQKAKDDEAQKIKDEAIKAAKDAVKNTTTTLAYDPASHISQYISPFDKYISPNGELSRKG